MSRSREENFQRNNAFSLYDLYDHALTQETQEALPGGFEIYNISRVCL